MKRALARLACAALFATAAAALAAACVETAECDALVRCGAGQVCYNASCYERCEFQGACSEGRRCQPCVEPGASPSESRCIGEMDPMSGACM